MAAPTGGCHRRAQGAGPLPSELAGRDRAAARGPLIGSEAGAHPCQYVGYCRKLGLHVGTSSLAHVEVESSFDS
jgi:hypothetical protein